mgnify:CR=1 FL=1
MDIVETAQDKCPVPSEAAGYSLADNRTVQVSVGRQAGFRENQLLDDVQTTEKGNGGMRNREANLLPLRQASSFILHAENKQFIRIYFLTGNDLETSEVLYFSCFALKQKNALLNAKIQSISIIAKTIVREKGIANKLFKRRTILCILVFKSSLAFGEKLDGLQNMDNVQCLLSLSLQNFGKIVYCFDFLFSIIAPNLLQYQQI